MIKDFFQAVIPIKKCLLFGREPCLQKTCAIKYGERALNLPGLESRSYEFCLKVSKKVKSDGSFCDIYCIQR